MDAEANSREAIRRAWDRRVDEYARVVADPERRGLAVEIELAAFAEWLPEGRLKLMDAGCGVGAHGCSLLEMGHSVCFVDVSPGMLEACRANAQEIDAGGDARFIECDLRRLSGVGDDEFDGVISGGTVISDCGCPRDAMRELARVLRPGGVLGVSLRNLDGPQGSESGDPFVPNGGPGFDWWCFSLESAAELCERSGVTTARIYPVFAAAPDVGDAEGYVRQHLEAGDPEEWRHAAHELFVVATK